MQLAALVLFVIAFAAYPVVALVRRLRRPLGGPGDQGRAAAQRRRPRGGARLVSYLFYLVMTGGKLAAPGPVVAERPLIWLALQVLAWASVIATVLIALAWRRAGDSVPRGERVRLGLLLAGGVAFVPWALYWGLLLP